MMKMTEHAKKRKTQRGISTLALNTIERYGRSEHVPGGLKKIFFGRKERQLIICELKRTIQKLDKIKSGAIIIDTDRIVTLYHE